MTGDRGEIFLGFTRIFERIKERFVVEEARQQSNLGGGVYGPAAEPPGAPVELLRREIPREAARQAAPPTGPQRGLLPPPQPATRAKGTVTGY